MLNSLSGMDNRSVGKLTVADDSTTDVAISAEEITPIKRRRSRAEAEIDSDDGDADDSNGQQKDALIDHKNNEYNEAEAEDRRSESADMSSIDGLSD